MKTIALTVLTATITAAVLYSFLPLEIAGTIIFILAAHEFGHFFTAWLNGTKAFTPVFIPLGPIVIGVTRVLKDPQPFYTALAGPLAGIIAALLAIVISTIGGLSVMSVGVGMLFYELIGLVTGGDLKKMIKHWPSTRKVQNASVEC